MFNIGKCSPTITLVMKLCSGKSSQACFVKTIP